MNARRSPKVIDVDFTTSESPTTPSQSSSRRGEKFRALKAKEAAKKEAQSGEPSMQVDVAEEIPSEVNGAAEIKEEAVEVLAAKESAPKSRKKSSKKKGSRKNN